MRLEKKLLVIALMSFFMLCALSAQALAKKLTITNNTASEIHAIYISDGDSNDWEENIIEGYMLPSGNEVEIQIEGSYKQFDLRVEDEEGNYEDYMEFPGKTSQIVLHGEGDAEYR